MSEDVLDEAVGGDGTLPGGMPPEMLMEMMKDEELVGMLRSSKMQEVMKVRYEFGLFYCYVCCLYI